MYHFNFHNDSITKVLQIKTNFNLYFSISQNTKIHGIEFIFSLYVEQWPSCFNFCIWCDI